MRGWTQFSCVMVTFRRKIASAPSATGRHILGHRLGAYCSIRQRVKHTYRAYDRLWSVPDYTVPKAETGA